MSPTTTDSEITCGLLARIQAGDRTALDELLAERVRSAVARLDPDDQAIIVLRNYEQLSNQQAAEVLGIEAAAASKRFGRALLRLKSIFKTEPSR